ncbi:DUF982 domain-containing protein [Rhizobium sp. 32-5/1]|uniref:DUF982 domain-containing protein n=1 Tax=Rhizobium sp. 32-5/1 TaxID=3019602 RepID=UPI00240D2392|nr:DUF982 domain-containing protein [Rhizobium sp. 32-5/1]WEZ82105.1 DUF982 domain-containing protein [Rhizobium sp. 32-5/1]
MPARWNEPVIINAPVSGRVQVTGPFEALVVLMDEWPDLRGAGYVRARSMCRAAIAGRRDAEDARVQFIGAAKEANLMH